MTVHEVGFLVHRIGFMKVGSGEVIRDFEPSEPNRMNHEPDLMNP